MDVWGEETFLTQVRRQKGTDLYHQHRYFKEAIALEPPSE